MYGLEQEQLFFPYLPYVVAYLQQQQFLPNSLNQLAVMNPVTFLQQ
jgi:hypothetical protein